MCVIVRVIDAISGPSMLKKQFKRFSQKLIFGENAISNIFKDFPKKHVNDFKHFKTFRKNISQKTPFSNISNFMKFGAIFDFL